MKLPNYDNAIVAREKIVDHSLSLAHRDGRSKAIFFFSFGFSIETWETLAAALRHQAAAHEVAKIESTPFGARYVVEGELAAPAAWNASRRPLSSSRRFDSHMAKGKKKLLIVRASVVLLDASGLVVLTDSLL